MKTYWKNKWTKALRSGKYKQGKGALKTTRGNYCCLGVLCDIVAKSPTGKKAGARWDKREMTDGYEVNESLLPDFIRDIVGMESDDGYFDHNDIGYTCLTELNDNGKKFAEIADIIDKHYKEM